MTGLVRPATHRDRAAWRTMRERLYGPADHDAEIIAIMNDPERNAVFVYARADGRLGGFIEVGLRSYAEGCSTSPVAYVEGWYVDDDLRRSGVGRALVVEAEAWALRRGLTEMASDTGLENNVSIAAHRALGFEEVERAVLFKKPLRARKT